MSWNASEDAGEGFDAKAQQEAEERRISERSALREAMRNPHFRRWLGNLLFGPCFLAQTTVSADCDSNATMFRSGARAIGLQLQHDLIQAAKPEYLMLLSEHME